MNEVEIDSQNSSILKLSTSNPQKAFQEAKQILALSESNQYDKGRAEALRNLAFSSQSLGFIQEGFDFANQALRIFEELGDKKNLAHVYNTLGFIYDHLNEQENRLIANLKSKIFSFEINDTEGMIRSLNNTGDNYIQLGNYRDALNSFKECINLIQPTNHFMYAVVYCNIGEVNFLKKELEEAIDYFFLSLDHARKIKSNAVEATALLLLSKVYSAQENYEKALETLRRGVELFEGEQKEGGELIYLTNKDEEDSILKSSTNIEVEIYQLYAGICEKTGDIQAALWATKKSQSLEKILINAQHTKEFETVHLRYEITQLEKLVAERTQELERTFQELKTKENNNRLIIENAIDAVIIFDSNGKILQHNKKTIDFFHKPNQLTEYNLYDLLVFEDGTGIEKTIKKLFNPSNSLESLKFEMCDDKFTEYFQVALTRTKTEHEFQGIAFIGNVTHYKIAEKKRLIDLEIETRINHFSQFILSKNDYRELLFELVRMCIEELKFYNTTIYLKEESTGEFVQIVSQQADSFTKLDLLSSVQGSGYLLTSDSTEFITSRELKSQLSIPLKVAGELIGVINCGHYIDDFFNENHIRFLITIAPLLSNRVDKLKEQVQKELLQRELFEINQKLEQEVNLQTKKITELTHKYLEHEKFSLLAELASSISHELNTPFGIITNGAKEVNTALSELINCILDGELTMNSLNFALEFAKKKIEVPFSSYRNKRKYIADIKDYLISKDIDADRSFNLAQEFVNAKFTINDEDEINFVLKTEKQNELLNIIYYIEKTLLLSNSIIETSNSASLIVQELTKIAIGSKTFDTTKINLLENINSVLAVYKYMFDAISIQLNVPDNIEISGNEINLFQLWKNAFMLASNLFEETEVDKYIRLKTEVRELDVFIELSFNGKKISDEIIANILDVTPIIESSNNTIIGKLSMIKKIITDHKGRMSIISNENTVIFIELPYTFSSI
jgi:tetratricopeptide (TPR) repeat protein/signal transduction histidine kinase